MISFLCNGTSALARMAQKGATKRQSRVNAILSCSSTQTSVCVINKFNLWFCVIKRHRPRRFLVVLSCFQLRNDVSFDRCFRWKSKQKEHSLHSMRLCAFVPRIRMQCISLVCKCARASLVTATISQCAAAWTKWSILFANIRSPNGFYVILILSYFLLRFTQQPLTNLFIAFPHSIRMFSSVFFFDLPSSFAFYCLFLALFSFRSVSVCGFACA